MVIMFVVIHIAVGGGMAYDSFSCYHAALTLSQYSILHSMFNLQLNIVSKRCTLYFHFFVFMKVLIKISIFNSNKWAWVKIHIDK